jgi:hypothetical protein
MNVTENVLEGTLPDVIDPAEFINNSAPTVAALDTPDAQSDCDDDDCDCVLSD